MITIELGIKNVEDGISYGQVCCLRSFKNFHTDRSRIDLMKYLSKNDMRKIVSNLRNNIDVKIS